MKFADVIILGIGDPYSPLLTYAAIEGIGIGSVVSVPYGRQSALGVVIKIHDEQPSFVTKAIEKVVYTCLVPDHLIHAAYWMSEYYHEPLQRCFESILVSKKSITRLRKTRAQVAAPLSSIDLNPDQIAAKNAILSGLESPARYLLHGITGSGKTEVYLSVMDQVLKQGRSVIYLVPEIALTPQTVTRVQQRLGDCIRVMTSQLSDGERFSLVKDIEEGRCRVVVGSRSALFSPFADLGLIVIDESHDGSYKQDASPHYSAITVAQEIASHLRIPLVLGSATPTVWQHFQTESSEYSLLSLASRAGDAALPEIAIADMREELKKKNYTTISDRLEKVLAETLNRQEQAVLFINRRGFAHALVCRACGWRAICPRCSVALVYHREYFGKRNCMVCHQCDHQEQMKASCPQCSSMYIKPLGSGTERVVEDVLKCFPSAKVCRMDRDTTSKKGAHEELYHAFARREYDILIGTQMVTKGWDMPHVTCVGIVNADSMLHMPFYDAAENAYSLMTQVSGRAGRTKERPGQVVIQTYSPEHYAVVATQSHDFLGFYRQELQYRKLLSYPPFSTMVELTLSHTKQETAKRKAEELASLLVSRVTELKQHDTMKVNCEIFGPLQAPILRVNEIYYYQIILKGDKALLDQLLTEVSKEWSINVDI